MPDTKRKSKEIAALLVAIARLGNNETYATYHPNSKAKYRPRAGSVSAEVITAHLNDQQPIGCYFILQDITHAAIIDFDDHDGALSWREMTEYAKPVIDKLRQEGLKLFLCRSGGGAGLHAWMFWEKPQKANLLRQYLNHLISGCGFKSGTKGVQDKQVEIFPKSDSLKQGKLGNLIALPFARKSVPLDGDLHPIEWSDYNPPKLEELYSKNVAELYQPPPPKKEKPAKSKPAAIRAKTEYSAEILPGDEGEARIALQHIASDDYEMWIKIGFALKNAFGTAGFDLWDKWSSKSSRYGELEETRKAWDRLEPDGTLTIGTIFFHAQEAGWEGPSNKVIRDMNSRFGVLTHGNATRIVVKDFQGSEVLSLLGKAPFQDRLKPERFPVTDEAGNTHWREKSTYWLNHHLTAHYYEVIFDPSKPPGHNGKQWNTWRGFAVKPKEGDWSLLRQHILDNICKGIPERNDWFLNWLALGVQQPASVIGTAPVLIGLPGTGKGVLANAYARLWHPHSVSVTKDDHVSGRFNQHLEGRRFVLLDEAMFGGDRKNAGVIKTYMTEPRIMIERKGIDPIWYDNHMIFMASSNERSVVPADIGDRRWQVFEVLPDKRDDKTYFSAIMKQLDNGGYEAMLYDLLERDISRGPDPRKTIKTPELFEQAIQALGPIEKYIYQILDSGYLPQPDAPGNGPGITTIAAMYAEMKRHYPAAQHTLQTIFGRELNKIFPTMRTTQSGQFIEGYMKSGEPIIVRSKRYYFPPLPDARCYFELHMGQDIPWSDNTPEWLGDVNPPHDYSGFDATKKTPF